MRASGEALRALFLPASIARRSIARARTVAANDSRSTTSPTRTPTRRALSAYAGPMPFLVVPIWLRPRNRSITASSFLWYGMIRWGFDEMRSRDVSMPRDSSMSSSSRSTLGSITVPDAITGTPGARLYRTGDI